MRSVTHRLRRGKKMPMPRRLLLVLTSMCFVLSLACCFLLQSVLVPTFGEAEYITNDGVTHVSKLPVSIVDPRSEMRVTIPIFVRTPFAASTFRIIPDDCIRKAWLNGKELEEKRFATCDYGAGKIVSFPELQTGTNILEVVIENKGGHIGISVLPSHLDATVIGMTIIELLIALWFLLQLFSFSKKGWLMGIGGAIGIALFGWLRMLYAFATPWLVRSYDATGHLEYVQYLLTHATLPPRLGGWEFYHPPLYYILNALAAKTVEVFAQVPLHIVMQIVSAVLAVATVPVIFWIANKLPSHASHSKNIVLYTVLALPGFVFFAGRVNNDVLLLALQLLVVLLCLKFWEKKSMRLWYLAIFLSGCAVLTKTSGAVLLPFVAATLLLHPKIRLREKLLRSVLGLLLFLGLTMWFFVPQLLENGVQRTSLVGNLGNLHGGLQLHNTLESYFTFSPKEILQHPFNSPWLDSERRQFFLEYFFRSAFFGEFDFKKDALHVSIALLASWLLLLPWLAYGLWEALRKKTSIDALMGILLGSIVLGHFFFRFVAHYSSVQDFRFSPLIVVSIIWLLLRALDGVKGFWRAILLWLLGVTLFLELAFLITIILS